MSSTEVSHNDAASTQAADDIKRGRNSALPPNHPINALSPLRKALALMTLSYAGLLGNFHVAIILVAFVPIAETFKTTPPNIANCVGYSFLGMAVGPLIWNPLSRTIGRRPVYLIGSVLLIPCAIWLALSNTYGTFAAGRVVMGFFNSWSQTVPPSTITDMYIEQVMGSKITLYVVCIVIAPAVAPIFCAAFLDRTSSWRNLFWFVLGLCVLQLVLFFFFVPETMWNEADSDAGPVDTPAFDDSKEEKHLEHNAVALHTQGAGRVGAAWMPWHRGGEFASMVASPIIMFKYIAILLASVYYGMVFAWSVSVTIILPQVYGPPPYNFSVIGIGAAYLAYGIGGVLGIPLGGIVGDKCVSYFRNRNGDRQPEYRLWAVLPILPIWFAACLIIGFALEKELHWIAFLMGGGIMYVCLTAVTGVLQTYVLETYLPKGQDTQAVFTFWRLMWAFSVAFYAMQWGQKTSFLSEFIVQGATGTGLGAVVCGLLIWKGRAIRKAQGMPEA